MMGSYVQAEPIQSDHLLGLYQFFQRYSHVQDSPYFLHFSYISITWLSQLCVTASLDIDPSPKNINM